MKKRSFASLVFTAMLSSSVLSNTNEVIDKGVAAFKSKNYQDAYEYISQAAESNDDHALFLLGLLYKSGKGVSQDSFKAKTLFEKSAVQGHKKAAYFLAEYYLYEVGVKQDKAQALHWFEVSANNGYSESAHKLGVIYYFGVRGVGKNIEKSIFWLTKAAKEGVMDATYLLGDIYSKEESNTFNRYKAIEYLKIAADSGMLKAQVQLGDLYYKNGRRDLKSYERAFHYYEKAAAQKNSHALSRIGNMYLLGNGVEKDVTKSLEIKEELALGGSAYDKHLLGVLYFNGRHFKPNFHKAKYWLELAASDGEGFSYNTLGQMYMYGHGVNQDFEKAKSLFRQSKAANVKFADELLANLAKFEKCSKSASTSIFGMKLICANKRYSRRTLLGAGLERIELSKNGDVFSSAKALTGSSQLYVESTWKSKIYRVQYTFPSQLDVKKVVEVKDMIISKYGNPDKVIGNHNVGEVKYSWTLDDGVVVEVSRGWPDTTSYLTYITPSYFEKVKAENQSQQGATKYSSQSNAF